MFQFGKEIKCIVKFIAGAPQTLFEHVQAMDTSEIEEVWLFFDIDDNSHNLLKSLLSKSNNTNSSSSSSSTGIFANLKEQLNGREFIIVTEGYNSKTSIGFKGDRVYGFSGINRYFGTYQISGGKFIFSDFGLTQMAGSEEEMTKELQSSRYIVISFLVREMWNRITRTLQQVKKGETNYSTVYT